MTKRIEADLNRIALTFRNNYFTVERLFKMIEFGASFEDCKRQITITDYTKFNYRLFYNIQCYYIGLCQEKNAERQNLSLKESKKAYYENEDELFTAVYKPRYSVAQLQGDELEILNNL